MPCCARVFPFALAIVAWLWKRDFGSVRRILVGDPVGDLSGEPVGDVVRSGPAAPPPRPSPLLCWCATGIATAIAVAADAVVATPSPDDERLEFPLNRDGEDEPFPSKTCGAQLLTSTLRLGGLEDGDRGIPAAPTSKDAVRSRRPPPTRGDSIALVRNRGLSSAA